MKIVAKMDNNKVLCTVSGDEIARLRGFNSLYDNKFNTSVELNIGNEIDLKTAFDTLDILRNFDKKQIKNLYNVIKKMETEYSCVLEAYQKLMLFDNLKTMGDDK